MMLGRGILPIKVDTTYTLKGNEKGVVIVDVNSKRDFDDEVISVGKRRMKMAGSYQETLEVDEASGWLIRSKANMRFSGEMKMAGNNQVPQGMMVPISIESIITVKPME